MLKSRRKLPNEVQTRREFRNSHPAPVSERRTEIKTIRDQGLQGSSDQHLYEVCCSEKWCLVTLDLGFSNVTRFPPTEANGIVVIRVPRNPSLTLLEQLVSQFLQTLSHISIDKRLWIVEGGRIRIHQSETDEEE